MHQLLHHTWILAKSMLSEAATAVLPAGLRVTASTVESSSYADSLFSTSSNTLPVYRMNRRRQNTLPCGMKYIYPKRPHRKGGFLHTDGCKVDYRLRLHWFILCTRRSGGLFMRQGYATSQLDLPSLTPLSVDGCDSCRSSPLSCFSRLLQLVDNWPHILS